MCGLSRTNYVWRINDSVMIQIWNVWGILEIAWQIYKYSLQIKSSWTIKTPCLHWRNTTLQIKLFFLIARDSFKVRVAQDQPSLSPLEPGATPNPYPPALVSSGNLICATLLEGSLPGTCTTHTHTQTHRPVLTAHSNYWPCLSHGLHLC